MPNQTARWAPEETPTPTEGETPRLIHVVCFICNPEFPELIEVTLCGERPRKPAKWRGNENTMCAKCEELEHEACPFCGS